jgi:hypothetical protein
MGIPGLKLDLLWRSVSAAYFVLHKVVFGGGHPGRVGLVSEEAVVHHPEGDSALLHYWPHRGYRSYPIRHRPVHIQMEKSQGRARHTAPGIEPISELRGPIRTRILKWRDGHYVSDVEVRENRPGLFDLHQGISRHLPGCPLAGVLALPKAAPLEGLLHGKVGQCST